VGRIPVDWWRGFFTGVALDVWRSYTTDDLTRAEADFIERALALPPASRVLDVPCGGGRHALELTARGHALTGVDLAAEFVEEARAAAAERKLEVAWERRDMRDLPWPAAFDGAFSFGNSFGYLEDEGNAAFLAAVARALVPGGRFVLDTGMVLEALAPNLEERTWYEMGDIVFLLRHRYDHVRGRLETEYTFVRDGRTERRASTHRVYTYRELCGLLAAAGFGDVEAYGSLDREPFRFGSPRLLLVAQKRGEETP